MSATPLPETNPVYGPFFGVMGAASAIIFSGKFKINKKRIHYIQHRVTYGPSPVQEKKTETKWMFSTVIANLSNIPIPMDVKTTVLSHLYKIGTLKV